MFLTVFQLAFISKRKIEINQFYTLHNTQNSYALWGKELIYLDTFSKDHDENNNIMEGFLIFRPTIFGTSTKF